MFKMSSRGGFPRAHQSRSVCRTDPVGPETVLLCSLTDLQPPKGPGGVNKPMVLPEHPEHLEIQQPPKRGSPFRRSTTASPHTTSTAETPDEDAPSLQQGHEENSPDYVAQPCRCLGWVGGGLRGGGEGRCCDNREGGGGVWRWGVGGLPPKTYARRGISTNPLPLLHEAAAAENSRAQGLGESFSDSMRLELECARTFCNPKMFPDFFSSLTREGVV